jgi:uncharacterized protein (DUF433 family)
VIPTPAVVNVPVRIDEHGKIRVGNTRVLLELVIRAFQSGDTPEGIIDSYPSLQLADVYAVITYYLTHRSEVNAYMRQADAHADQIQREIEADYSPEVLALRARLRARLEANKQSE